MQPVIVLPCLIIVYCFHFTCITYYYYLNIYIFKPGSLFEMHVLYQFQCFKACLPFLQSITTTLKICLSQFSNSSPPRERERERTLMNIEIHIKKVTELEKISKKWNDNYESGVYMWSWISERGPQGISVRGLFLQSVEKEKW